MGGGMDTYMYIACLRQVVAFAPKVIIACLRQGFCIRKTLKLCFCKNNKRMIIKTR